MINYIENNDGPLETLYFTWTRVIKIFNIIIKLPNK